MKISGSDLVRDSAFSHLVFQKIKKNVAYNISEESLYECELIKKGKLTKNKRYFVFYTNKCLFYQVNFLFSFSFNYFFFNFFMVLCLSHIIFHKFHFKILPF